MPATTFTLVDSDLPQIIKPDVDLKLLTIEDIDVDKLTTYVKSKYEIARGDLVIIEDIYDECYGGNGRFIYDGTTFLDLIDEESDFDRIPSVFHILTDFPLNHWDNANIGSKRWIDLPHFREQLLANIQKGQLPYIKEEVTYTTFIHEGKDYQIVFDLDNEDEDITSDGVVAKISDLTNLHLEANQVPYNLGETNVPVPSNVLFTW